MFVENHLFENIVCIMEKYLIENEIVMWRIVVRRIIYMKYENVIILTVPL